MTVTVDSFREHFPAFVDEDRYSDDMIQYWLSLAEKLVNNGVRWGSLRDNGIELFIAHNVSLERRAMDQAEQGQVPGGSPGIVNSKSVDKVSVGYDTQGGAELDAGHWNLTIWGTRYIRLVRIIGAGPVQVGADTAVSVSSAWPGPYLP